MTPATAAAKATRGPRPPGGGDHFGFQVKGMIEGFFGFEIFDSVFLGGKENVGKYFFFGFFTLSGNI